MEEKENRKGKMNQNKKIEKEDSSPPGPCPCQGPKSPAPEAGPTSPLPFPLFLSLPGGTHLSARSSPTVSPPSPVTSPELLPRHHRDLIAINTRRYKKPALPSLLSLSFLCSRQTEDDGICRRSSARLRASPSRFGAHGEPRAPSLLLILSTSSDAPP
jgi:hypothetical protein